MPSAFAKCGIFPLCQERALERLPMPLTEEEIAANLDGALVEELQKQRYGDKKERAKRQKDRVPPGVSYTEVSFFFRTFKMCFFCFAFNFIFYENMYRKST